jgi:hypothetical protein
VSELIVVPAQRRFPDAVAVRFTAANASEITQWTNGLLCVNKKTYDLELDYPVDGRGDPEAKKTGGYGETIVRARAVEGDWIVFNGKFQTVTNSDFEVEWDSYPERAVGIDIDAMRRRPPPPPPPPPPMPPDDPLGWYRNDNGPWMPWDGQG